MSRWFLLATLLFPHACLSDSEAEEDHEEREGSVLDAAHPNISFEEGTPRPDRSSSVGPTSCGPPWTPTTHLPGTLLRDRGGRFWVVGRWPDRHELLPWLFAEAPYRLDEAIELTSEEAHCLRASIDVWLPHTHGRLRRLSDSSLWYVDERAGYRRLARPHVIATWHDTALGAEVLELTTEAFASRFRDLGPLPPPDGTLFVSSGVYYLFSEGKLAPFADAALLRQVGYDPAHAISITATEQRDYLPFAPPLTSSTFNVCPLAAAQLRTTEDRDGDGVPFFQDCDDEDGRRFPHHPETCDSIDNDCDLVVDNGFDVGLLCRMNNTCHTATYTRCATDHLHTECEDDEAICAE